MSFTHYAMIILILLCFPLLVPADYVYLDEISVSDDRYDAMNHVLIEYDSGSATHRSHSADIGSMDIIKAGYRFDGTTITSFITFRATPILNSSIKYWYVVNFSLNNSVTLTIHAGVTNSSILPELKNYAIYLTDDSITDSRDQLVYHEKGLTAFKINEKQLYWEIDLTGLDTIMNIKKYFEPYSLLKQMDKDYQINPKIYGSVRNDYSIYPTNGVDWSDYVEDEFYTELDLDTSQNEYRSQFIFCGILMVFVLLMLYSMIKERKKWRDRTIKGRS